MAAFLFPSKPKWWWPYFILIVFALFLFGKKPRATLPRRPSPSAIMLTVMLGNRTSAEWIAQYATSHQHPVNRLCHTFGIPLILVSLGFFVAGFFFHRLWWAALAFFVIGWIFQFVGHAFEGKPPEFFQDWRFLFVGVRWWWAKIHGKA